MNKKVRKNFSASFKKKIALEALEEQETLSSLCTKFELHASQITDWKKQLLSGTEQIFNGFKADTCRTSDDALPDELYKQIGQLTVENDWLKKILSKYLGKASRMALIDKDMRDLSIGRQCELLALPRSTYYYRPAQQTAENLLLMRTIDELHLNHPYSGVLQMQAELRTEENPINEKRIRRLMSKMGIETLYQKPNTSKPCACNKRFPYLLRDLKITYPNQVWSTDITYIPMKNGFMYLCAIVDL